MRSSSACAGSAAQVGPQVQAEAAEVDGPYDVGDVGDDQRVGGGAVRRRNDGRLQPVRGPRRDAFLEEGLACGPFGEALEESGTPAGGVEQVIADVEVIRHEVQLCAVDGGKVDLVRPADADLAPVDLHDAFVVTGHRLDSSEGALEKAQLEADGDVGESRPLSQAGAGLPRARPRGVAADPPPSTVTGQGAGAAERSGPSSTGCECRGAVRVNVGWNFGDELVPAACPADQMKSARSSQP